MSTSQKDHSFFTFVTTKKVYDEIANLSWIERQTESRKLSDGIETTERLKVVGKQFVVGYTTDSGEHHIREKFRFACEMLVAVETLMKGGGQVVRDNWENEA